MGIIKSKLVSYYPLFVIVLLFGFFREGNLLPQLHSGEVEIPSLAIEQIAMDYLKFNFEVVNALTSINSDDGDDDEQEEPQQQEYDGTSGASNPSSSPGGYEMNTTADSIENNKKETNNEDDGLYTGSSAGSSFGMGQILAVLHQDVLPVSTVVFNNALKDAPDYLPEIYQLLLSTVLDDEEFRVINTMYVDQSMKIDTNKTQILEQLSTNVSPVNFQDKEVVNIINTEIFKNIIKGSELKQSYIPTGTKALPKSTKAMLIHTLSYKEKWSPATTWKKIEGRKFNGKDALFVEIEGNFPYLESDRAIEVSIPIKNDTSRVISLILPRNLEDALNGDLGVAQNGTTGRLRLQLPLFNFTVRVPHNGGVSKRRDCDFEKKQNFLNVLDDLTFVNFNDGGISAVAITGVQINNVEQYKEELLELKKKYSTENPGQASSTTTTTTTASSTLPEPAKLVSKDANSSGNILDKTVGGIDEKIIIFDRPFTVTLVDESLFPIPIFSAAVVSLSDNLDLTKVVMPRSHDDDSVFGLDETISYLNCL